MPLDGTLVERDFMHGLKSNIIHISSLVTRVCVFVRVSNTQI